MGREFLVILEIENSSNTPIFDVIVLIEYKKDAI